MVDCCIKFRRSPPFWAVSDKLSPNSRGIQDKASLAKQGDPLPDDFPKDLVDMIEDWQFETDADNSGTKHGLWLHSTYGGVDAVCAFIQHLLQEFDPQGKVSFEWSHDCSKPRVNAYGGGAAFITAKEIKSMSTAAWLNEQIA